MSGNHSENAYRNITNSGSSVVHMDNNPQPTLLIKILDALVLTRANDDRDALISSKGDRVDGTCEWIKSEPGYIEWIDSQSNALWVSGGPGKGKTMLSIYLTQELEEQAKSTGEILLYFFCVSGDDRRNSATAILRSLLYQLLDKQPEILRYAESDFKSENIANITTSSFDALWRIFTSMLQDKALPPVFCVVDGLDECETLDPFLKKIHDLFLGVGSESAVANLKMLIVSRDEPKIRTWFRDFIRIRLDPDSDDQVSEDITRYISQKVKELFAAGKPLIAEGKLSETDLKEVEQALKDGAKGTFLWVGFVANGLIGKNRVAVRKLLQDLPHGLNDIYKRMLEQVEPEYKDGVQLILQWIVVAQLPLTLKELVAGTKIDEDDIISYLEFCGQFLQPIENDTVNLIHESAKDYLQLAEPYKAHAHVLVAKICLEYIAEPLSNQAMNIPKIFDSYRDSRIQRYPLLEYAIIFWPEHARWASLDTKHILDFSSRFFKERSSIRDNWLTSYWTWHELNSIQRMDEYPTSFTLMHLAAFFGFEMLARKLVEMNKAAAHTSVLVNQKDNLGQTPLVLASMEGHVKIVELLLHSDADVNTQCGSGVTALHIALGQGDEAVVRLLLESGADVNIQSEYGYTALHIASQQGHKAVVRLLLESGADVNIQSEYGDTALYIALRWDYKEVVKLLIKAGAFDQ